MGDNMNLIKFKHYTKIYINDVLIPDTAFVGLIIEKAFHDDMFPCRILYLDFNIETIQELNLENKAGLLDVEILVYRTPEVEDEPDAQPEVYLEEKFKGILDKYDSKILESDIDLIYTDPDTRQEFKERHRIFLYNEDYEYFGKNYINFTTAEWTVGGLILKGFEDTTSDEARLFMETPSNQIEYDKQIIIGPTGFRDLLKRIDEEFVLYDKSPYMFIENDTCYLMSRDGDFKYDVDDEELVTKFEIFISEETQLHASILNGVDIDTGKIYLPIKYIQTYRIEDDSNSVKGSVVNGVFTAGESKGLDYNVLHQDYEMYKPKTQSLLMSKILYLPFILIDVKANDMIIIHMRDKEYKCKIMRAKTYLAYEMNFTELELLHYEKEGDK